MIGSYRYIIENFNSRFPRFIKEYNKETGDVISEKFARTTRNWILELDNILNYRPVFSTTPNTVDTREEFIQYQTFLDNLKESIRVWHDVLERYHGGMLDKLRTSMKNEGKIPKLVINYVGDINRESME